MAHIRSVHLDDVKLSKAPVTIAADRTRLDPGQRHLSRQTLEEAVANGADPLRLSVIFRIDDANARRLLGTDYSWLQE